jgi:hypothetical protein
MLSLICNLVFTMKSFSMLFYSVLDSENLKHLRGERFRAMG